MQMSESPGSSNPDHSAERLYQQMYGAAERQVALDSQIIDNHLTRVERSLGILANRAILGVGQQIAENPPS
jgi:hypothetical protein